MDESSSDDEIVGELARALEQSRYEEEEPEEADEDEVLRRLSASLRAMPPAAPGKPTPYEVWAAGREKKKKSAPPGPKKLKEREVAGLVSRLSSRRDASKAATKQLREEMKELTFSPRLCRASRAHSMDVDGARARFEARMRRARERAMDDEMSGCTFAPSLSTRSSTPRRSTNDLFKFAEDQRDRREQRRRVVDDLEAAELTFSPALNRRSLAMAAKGGTPRRRRPLRLEEPPFQPTISERAKHYKPKGDTDVCDRLYAMAKAQLETQHNEAVAVLEAGVRVPDAMKKWETTKLKHPPGATKAAWVSEDHVPATDSRQHFTVLEYSRDLDDLLDLVASATPLDPPRTTTSPPARQQRPPAVVYNAAPPPKTHHQNAHLAAASEILDDDDDLSP